MVKVGNIEFFGIEGLKFGWDEGEVVLMPQTNGCVQCDAAYESPNSFICHNCSMEMEIVDIEKAADVFMAKVSKEEQKGVK